MKDTWVELVRSGNYRLLKFSDKIQYLYLRLYGIFTIYDMVVINVDEERKSDGA